MIFDGEILISSQLNNRGPKTDKMTAFFAFLQQPKI
jgi:hypothetical protein